MADLPRIDSLELASYILARLGPTKHLKLQKLLYYIEAWHLAALDGSIVADDFEAWLHGPVSRRVWDKYKGTSTLYDPIPIAPADAKRAKEIVRSRLSDEQLELIEDVLEEYGSKTAYHLERLTHSEDPWRVAREGVADGESSSNKISKDLMKSYYRKRLDTPA